MKNLLVRGGVLAATSALVSGALLVAPAAQADPSPSSTSATSWLTTQLSNGLVRNTDGTPNYSLSIDVARAEQQGGTPGVATQVRDAIAPTVSQWIEGSGSTAGARYADRTAKVLGLVAATGGSTRSYGGVDLVARLESLTAATGKLTDANNPNFYYTTFGQALGVEALTATTSAKAPLAAGYLLQQQCPAGFFRIDDATPCTDQTAADTDTTAEAVLSLQGQLAVPATKAAVDRAVAWLKAHQAADGSFIGSFYTPSANTSSTGLAAAALGASCEVGAADRAAAFVRSLQVPAGTTGPLANSVGAVAYDQATLTDGRANGIPANDQFGWRTPTAQAAAGLTWDPAATSNLKVKGPRGGFVKAGDSVEYRINRVAAGERVCVTTPDGTQTLTGTGSSLKVMVKTRKKADTSYDVSATTGPGVTTKTVTPLPRARLKSAFAKRVGRGDRVRVTVKKLEAKEKVLLKVDGTVVAQGKADDKGRFVTRFRAPKKVGKHTLLSQGGFANRKVRATFTVTR